MAICADVHVARGSTGRGLAKVECRLASITHVDDQKSTAAEIAGRRKCDGKRECGRYRRIDRVSSVAQHGRSHVCRDRRIRCDHTMCGGDGCDGIRVWPRMQERRSEPASCVPQRQIRARASSIRSQSHTERTRAGRLNSACDGGLGETGRSALGPMLTINSIAAPPHCTPRVRLVFSRWRAAARFARRRAAPLRSPPAPFRGCAAR